MKKQRDFLKLMAAFAFMIFTVVVALYLVNQKTNYLPQATTNYENYEVDEQVPDINAPEDLDAQLDKLDNIDVNQMNSGIINNDADSSGL
jgi:hypothetical protein